MPRLSTLLALASLATIALASVHAAPLAPASIHVVDFAFEDAATGLPASVSAGGAAVWTNVAGVHTVTALDGSFDSGPLDVGQTYSPALDPGAYVYSCIFHPSMRGVIVVA